MTRWICVLVCLMAWPAAAQERAPDRRDVVEAVSAADPARFACAHTERGCKNDWIKAVGAALHATDARWGLNGKRGNAADLSMDVVTWRIGPTDRHVQAFDICGACGGGSPSVTWSDITNWATIGNPGTAIWIKPESVSDGGTPVVTPPVVPTVDLAPLIAKIDAQAAQIAALMAKLDALGANVAKAAHESEQAAIRASAIKTQIENLPASQPVVFPCMRGSVYGRGVRFCPEGQ